MKKILALMLSIALILSMTACSSNKLADSFDKDKVIARAEELVGTVNTFDYSTVVSQLRQDLQAKLTADQLETSWGTQLKAAGNFVGYSSENVYGTKDKSTGEDYAVTVLSCKYENATLTYTISMNDKFEIVGLYMK